MPLLGLPIFITAVGLPLQWHSGFCVIAVGQAAKRKQFLGNTFAGILQQRQQFFACALPKHVTSCVMLLVGGRCSLHSRVAISIRLVGACLGWVVGVQMLNGTMYLHTLIEPPIRKFFGFDGNNGFSFFAFASFFGFVSFLPMLLLAARSKNWVVWRKEREGGKEGCFLVLFWLGHKKNREFL